MTEPGGKKKAPGDRPCGGRGHDRRDLARACRRCADAIDVSTAAVARQLGLAPRTVRAWAAPPSTVGPGRPVHAITRAEAGLMRMAMRLDGPHVAIATLQAWCPTVSRRAIAAWRRRERQRQRQRSRVLGWTQPRRVWAMDFSDAPHPIDGQYRALLHVRDLASQYHLAALPVPRRSSGAACGLVRALCATAAAPLVLKVDNGSAFRSRRFRAWADAAGTTLLYSPPQTPRYNGAIEGSIGALTTRAHHAAVLAGHPEYWTCADVEGARLAANAAALRASHPTPVQRWQQASPLTPAERRRFHTRCAGVARTITAASTAVRQRTAIVDTLQRLGYVSITRRADLVHHLNSKPRQELRA